MTLEEKQIVNYSQNDEQRHILEACAGIPRGRFLDIGAWNAKDKSNTRAPYELGWGGVVIEPSPGPLKGLIEEYGKDDRVTVVSAAIGPVRGLAKLHVTDDCTSTTDGANFHKWNRICNFYGSFFVPVVTLADILNQWGAFDFVSIDAEGVSPNIFRQLMDTEMFPRCICVEHDGDIDIPNIAQERGYRILDRNGENVVLGR